MATAHLYLREQVSGSNEDVARIKSAFDALTAAIESVGGSVSGDCRVVVDEPEAAPAEGTA
jgi:hypothetical protein